MSPPFRFLAEEEAFLEARIIADDVKSGKNNKEWYNSLVEGFQDEFPCGPRTLPNGLVETQGELMMRWKNVPRVSAIRNHPIEIYTDAMRALPP